MLKLQTNVVKEIYQLLKDIFVLCDVYVVVWTIFNLKNSKLDQKQKQNKRKQTVLLNFLDVMQSPESWYTLEGVKKLADSEILCRININDSEQCFEHDLNKSADQR